MDLTLNVLRAKLREHPDNHLLSNSVQVMSQIISAGLSAPLSLQAAALFSRLEEEGLWKTDDAERALADEIEKQLAERVSVVTIVDPPPPPSSPRDSFGGKLDEQLMKQLNEVAFLHVLATKPEKVIPPGKTLRAVLSSPDGRALNLNKFSSSNDSADGRLEDARPSLQEQVEGIVHRAFWDEALESLADPAPSCQLARLKRLYADLHSALSPLLPQTHPIMVVFSSPLSPTPAPLLSAIRHLRELTSVLRARCAPVRDEELDSIADSLNQDYHLSPSHSISQDGSISNDHALAGRVINAMRRLLRLTDAMKSDFSSTLLGIVSDEELVDMTLQATQESEREIVEKLYGASELNRRWQTWLDDIEQKPENSTKSRFIHRLMKALGSDIAMSHPLPGPHELSEQKTALVDGDHLLHEAGKVDGLANASNILPPQLLFSTYDLLYLQNQLQALVIAAALRTLVPIGPNRAAYHANNTHVLGDASRNNAANANVKSSTGRARVGVDSAAEHTFTERVLTLLMTEIDESKQDSTESPTKLIHLADEVVQEHRRLRIEAKAGSDAGISSSSASSSPALTRAQFSSHQAPSEQYLRTAVDALLKPTSSVFILLRRRLLSALSDMLLRAFALVQAEPNSSSSSTAASGFQVPENMRAGPEDVSVRERERKRLRMDLALDTQQQQTKKKRQRLRGQLRRVLVSSSSSLSGEGSFYVKGFEDPVLSRGIGEALVNIADVVEWVFETWLDGAV